MSNARIARAFELSKSEGRPAAIPFLTAGDPEPSLTVPLCEALARAGADIIELGVPFSDPVADGPTIQKSSQRAQTHGVGLRTTLDLTKSVRDKVTSALVLFSYYNPILRLGEEAFARGAADAGVDGVLVTDLPMEEGESLRKHLNDAGIDPVLLLAPTSGEERIRQTAIPSLKKDSALSR